jgi:hypothetical protein
VADDELFLWNIFRADEITAALVERHERFLSDFNRAT